MARPTETPRLERRYSLDLYRIEQSRLAHALARVADVYMQIEDRLMGIDRRSLSKINRKLETGLNRDEEWRMVRVPASEDVWLAWKPYCAVAKVSMGRALLALIESELRSLIDDGANRPIRVVDIDRVLREREADLVAREQRVADREANLRDRERRLSVRAHRTEIAGATSSDIGRNEPCPCGSGLKYKRCHSLPT